MRTADHPGTVPDSALLAAFGPDSLGIIVVSDLAPRFAALRTRLLSYASHIAAQPPAALAALEAPAAHYLVGWSCGKEALAAGRPDTLKGSYYVNCAFYKSHELDGADGADRYPDLPEYTAGNVWPAALPGFEAACKELCALVIDTAALVARACDRYAAAQVPDYVPGYLERVVKSSTTTKARLLHYFPPGAEEEDDDAALDSWCGTHLDHGCLTGLTSAMYVDEIATPPVNAADSVDLPELAGPPDTDAGLYIKDRAGEIVKVGIPRDALAFQTGEALERITRGRFRAVPHFVRGMASAKGRGVALNTWISRGKSWVPPRWDRALAMLNTAS